MNLKNRILKYSADKIKNATSFYLIYNKQTNKFEKIIFFNLSKIMKQLNLKLFKEYSIDNLNYLINKKDLENELNLIKNNLNQNYFNTYHRFYLNNTFFISNIYTEKINEDENYIHFKCISTPINHIFEHKLLYNLLLLNNFTLLLKYNLNNKKFEYNKIKFKKFFETIEKKEVNSVQETVFEHLNKLINKLNLKNIFSVDNLETFNNIENFQNNDLIHKDNINIYINNIEISLKLYIFKGIENHIEKIFIFLGISNEYNLNFLIEIFKILNNPDYKAILKDLFSNRKRKKNLSEYILLSNYEIKNKSLLSNFYLSAEINFDTKYKIKIYLKKNVVSLIKNSLLKLLKIKLENCYNNITKEETLTLLKNILDNSNDWILITNENGEILYINKIVEEISKFKKEEIIGKKPNIFKSGYTNKNLYYQMYKSLKETGYFEGLFINKTKNNQIFYLYNKIIKKNISGKTYYISISKNITIEKNKNINTKNIDKLTKLYNKNEFIETYKNNHKNTKCILLIDIVNFKTINLIKGTNFSEKLIKKISQELIEFFGYTNVYKEINDKFIITIDEKNTNEFDNNYNKLLSIFNNITKLLNKNLNYKIKFNIACISKEEIKNITDPKEILEKLKLTLEFTKNKTISLNNEITKYNKKIEYEPFIKARKLVEYGLKNNKFFYHYQPIVDKNKKIVGIETLLRLEKNNKIYYPVDYINYAEESGEIIKIDELLFKKMIKDINYLENPNIFVSFNITAKTISEKNVLKKMIKNLKQTNNKIIFEIIERNILIEDYINELKKYNIPISLDDFGTGYSSLFYLSKLEIDKLKIDRFFINTILKDEKTFIIIKNIINICKSLNIEIVAEGIEKKEEFEKLKELGCDYFQGYYFYKPIDIKEIKKLIKKGTKN